MWCFLVTDVGSWKGDGKLGCCPCSPYTVQATGHPSRAQTATCENIPTGMGTVICNSVFCTFRAAWILGLDHSQVSWLNWLSEPTVSTPGMAPATHTSWPLHFLPTPGHSATYLLLKYPALLALLCLLCTVVDAYREKCESKHLICWKRLLVF